MIKTSKGKNKRCFWSVEQDELLKELFRECYTDLGIKGIAKRLDKTIYAILHRVRCLGIRIPRVNWANKFWWTEENIAILKERYQIDGPKKLAEMLGTTQPSVALKARRLGIPSKNGRKHKPWKWKEWELEVLRNRYPTEDIKKLAIELGMPLYVLQRRARKLGIKNVTGRERAGRIKAENNKTCDIYYFHKWSHSMAWCLGFCFADASVTKRQSDIVIALAEKDRYVLDFIKKELKSTREICKVDGDRYSKKDGCNHQDSYWLTLSSKVLVKRVMELGMKPRKTYNDDPFPNVPDNMMSSFICGYFDGDGAVGLTGQGLCRVSFVGSVKFITGIKDNLVRLAGMKENNVGLEKQKHTVCGRLGWSAKEDLTKFYNFIYPLQHGFCLKRKKDRLRNWLLDKGVLI